MCSTNCLLVLLALIFPPLPVWIKRGLCSADSLINLALCCLGILPGLLHSWYIILNTPDEYELIEGDIEAQRALSHRGAGPSNGTAVYYVSQPEGRPNYGAAGGAGADAGARGAKDAGMAPPPAYQDAIKGDHKIQRS